MGEGKLEVLVSCGDVAPDTSYLVWINDETSPVGVPFQMFLPGQLVEEGGKFMLQGIRFGGLRQSTFCFISISKSPALFDRYFC